MPFLKGLEKRTAAHTGSRYLKVVKGKIIFL
jgi:hypothetical protein